MDARIEFWESVYKIALRELIVADIPYGLAAGQAAMMANEALVAWTEAFNREN